MKTIKTIANIVLIMGAMLTFNESDNFVINIIGIACLGALLTINRDKVIA